MSKVRANAIKAGYRSGFEERVALELSQAGCKAKYESKESVIQYTKPESKHKYTPDFILPNGIILECKGRLVLSDRQKHELISKQYPELDIRFVFQNSNVKIRKGSKTSYADWCDKNGFKYADGSVPIEWINET